MTDPVAHDIHEYVRHRQRERLGLKRDFPEFRALPWYKRLWYWLVSL